MRYFNEMNDKYGFSDGESTPQEALTARQIYIQTLNPLLQKHESQYRILPYDRGGCHNTIMWLRVPKTYFEQITQQDPRYWENTNHDPTLETNESDDAWDQAIEEAHTLNLDDYYETITTIRQPDYNQLLNQLLNQPTQQI